MGLLLFAFSASLTYLPSRRARISRPSFSHLDLVLVDCQACFRLGEQPLERGRGSLALSRSASQTRNSRRDSLLSICSQLVRKGEVMAAVPIRTCKGSLSVLGPGGGRPQLILPLTPRSLRRATHTYTYTPTARWGTCRCFVQCQQLREILRRHFAGNEGSWRTYRNCTRSGVRRGRRTSGPRSTPRARSLSSVYFLCMSRVQMHT